MWIDTHCHPFAKPFGGDCDEIILRSRETGVDRMIVVGFDKETNREAVKLAQQYDFIWAVVGVHPCECDQLTDEEVAWIKEAAKNPKVVAIGEIGLDYKHMSFPKDVQKECFRRQIKLAQELNLPCVIHSRDAAEDTLQILIEENAKKVVFHCYSYDYEFAKKVWAQGYYVSFTGVVTYPQAKSIQEVAAKAPEDLFFVETDCPYLAPQSIRGKRNEMAYVKEVGEKVAELREEKPELMAKITSENAVRFFGIM